MKSWRTQGAYWGVLAGALAALVALASCGGGGVVGSGGTGRAPGNVVGTVNGFGSVIVDGDAYENANAPVVREVGPGEDAPSDVRLGQRVLVAYEAVGVAKSVRVEPTVVGVVDTAAANGRFTMLGQTVTINSSLTSGPVTQFGGGYTQAGDVAAGDAVEVHGVIVGQPDAYVVRATRVDKLASPPAYLRVTGLLSHLAGGTFALGALSVDATNPSVLPEGGALAAGQSVTILALPTTLTNQGAGSWQLRAEQIRIDELEANTGDLDDYLSGSISNLDAASHRFALGSLAVDYTSATISGAATLANSQYVKVRGKVAADGTLVASSVAVRESEADNESELRGNIIGYDPATKRFTVRGTNVDAGNAQVENCPASGLAEGLYVEVHGALGSNGVIATEVGCEDAPSGSTIGQEGVASAVDTGSSTFTLTHEDGTAIVVQWSATTYFGGLAPQTLSGRRVQVEGVLAGGVLAAGKVQLES